MVAAASVASNSKEVVALVKKIAMRNLKLKDLEIDRTYQRDPKPAVIDAIVREFSEEAMGTLLVGQRPSGVYYIVDGQQRYLALKQMEWEEVRCEVFASQGAMHEAIVYKLVNLRRRKLSSLEEFKALLVAGDQDADAVKKTVEAEKWQLRVNTNLRKSPTDVKAVNTMLKIYRRRGVENLAMTLRIIKKAWSGDPQMSFATFLDGVSMFVKRVEDRKMNFPRLIKNFQSVTVQEVLYTSRLVIPSKSGESNRATAVADVLEKISRKIPKNSNKEKV